MKKKSRERKYTLVRVAWVLKLALAYNMRKSIYTFFNEMGNAIWDVIMLDITMVFPIFVRRYNISLTPAR